jgi:hypothetical protein
MDGSGGNCASAKEFEFAFREFLSCASGVFPLGRKLVWKAFSLEVLTRILWFVA